MRQSDNPHRPNKQKCKTPTEWRGTQQPTEACAGCAVWPGCFPTLWHCSSWKQPACCKKCARRWNDKSNKTYRIQQSPHRSVGANAALSRTHFANCAFAMKFNSANPATALAEASADSAVVKNALPSHRLNRPSQKSANFMRASACFSRTSESTATDTAPDAAWSSAVTTLARLLDDPAADLAPRFLVSTMETSASRLLPISRTTLASVPAFRNSKAAK
jgi:hypothetical protein